MYAATSCCNGPLIASATLPDLPCSAGRIGVAEDMVRTWGVHPAHLLVVWWQRTQPLGSLRNTGFVRPAVLPALLPPMPPNHAAWPCILYCRWAQPCSWRPTPRTTSLERSCWWMVAVPRCPCWPPRTLMHTRREEAMPGLTLVASTPSQPHHSKPFNPPSGWGAPMGLDHGQLHHDCALSRHTAAEWIPPMPLSNATLNFCTNAVGLYVSSEDVLPCNTCVLSM